MPKCSFILFMRKGKWESMNFCNIQIFQSSCVAWAGLKLRPWNACTLRLQVFAHRPNKMDTVWSIDLVFCHLEVLTVVHPLACHPLFCWKLKFSENFGFFISLLDRLSSFIPLGWGSMEKQSHAKLEGHTSLILAEAGRSLRFWSQPWSAFSKFQPTKTT